MARVFVIGDIHGCNNTFQKLLLGELQIQKSDKIYCLGDYIDRGHDSKGVIDFIIGLRKKGYHIHTLRGNHEQMMMESIHSSEKLNHWLKNGGDETLKSFGISSYDKMKSVYKVFFSRTKYFFQYGKYIFVHAGLNFEIENPFEDKLAMLWSRDFMIDQNKLDNHIIIHGHTPISINRILNQAGESVIDIDGGCVFKNREGLGNLVAFNLLMENFIFVKNVD